MTDSFSQLISRLLISIRLADPLVHDRISLAVQDEVNFRTNKREMKSQLREAQARTGVTNVGYIQMLIQLRKADEERWLQESIAHHNSPPGPENQSSAPSLGL